MMSDTMDRDRIQQPSWLYSPTSQWLSFLSAMLLSFLVLLFPQLLIEEGGAMGHGFLSLFMYGISAGFVFGVGFVPRNKIVAWLLGPWVGWSLMLFSILVLVVAL